MIPMEPKRDTEEAALPITLHSSSSQIPPGTRSHLPPASAAHSHPAGSGYARVRAPALRRKTGSTAPFPELQLAEPGKKSFKTPPSTANSASPFSPTTFFCSSLFSHWVFLLGTENIPVSGNPVNHNNCASWRGSPSVFLPPCPAPPFQTQNSPCGRSPGPLSLS